jgi:hypothetical protein
MLPFVAGVPLLAVAADPPAPAPRALLDVAPRVHAAGDLVLDYGVGIPLGFRLGDLMVEASGSLDPRLRLLARLTGGLEEGRVVLGAEALEARLRAGRFVEVRAGLFPTPLSAWADVGLHEARRYVTVAPPATLATDDAGAVLPVTLVGVDAHAEGSMGSGSWFGDLAVTNGRSPVFEAIEAGGDSSTLKSPLLRFGIREGGLTASLAGSYDRIVPTESGRLDQLTEPTDESIGALSLRYAAHRVDLLGEAFVIAHTTETIDPVVNEAAYLQLGVHLGAFEPFVRGEHLALASTDPLYGPQGLSRSESGVAVGLRYDVTPHAALKLEGDYVQRATVDSAGNEGGSQVIATHLQLAVGF